MQPLFTIHAGEYLVGSHIETSLKDHAGEKINVWIPSKDTGIDLLITDSSNKNTTSIQVKFSKDFMVTHGRPEHHGKLISGGWWNLDREKISNSKADYWIFVLHSFDQKNTQYIILKPKELLRRFDRIHPVGIIKSYFRVLADKKGNPAYCWDTRGLRKREYDKLVNGHTFPSEERDFTPYLNNWGALITHWA